MSNRRIYKTKAERREERRWRRTGDPAAWSPERSGYEVVLPQRLPLAEGCRLVKVFVEGYDDVAFWRGIFDDFESAHVTFEINVPQRADLAKGKKVLLKMLPESSTELLLCADSDFDYLFGEQTEQSRQLNTSPYMFHTYAYATENFCCYAPSLHNVCVRATKNDLKIFDFELFMERYSEIIYPLFIWYAYSAQESTENVFTLIDFKSSVKLNYLEVEDNGAGTLDWLSRQVKKRIRLLEHNHPGWEEELENFAHRLSEKHVTPQNVYLFMQGHTLMDNVVMVMLSAVCEKLKMISNRSITNSLKQGVALRNEMSNYNNSLRSLRDILLDNESYKECFLYKMLKDDIQRYIVSLDK